MDVVTAAAFPVAYGTAHFALAYRGNLKAGETLLVLGAAAIASVRTNNRIRERTMTTAKNGDMVAVWLSERGETTLKIFYNEGCFR